MGRLSETAPARQSASRIDAESRKRRAGRALAQFDARAVEGHAAPMPPLAPRTPENCNCTTAARHCPIRQFAGDPELGVPLLPRRGGMSRRVVRCPSGRFGVATASQIAIENPCEKTVALRTLLYKRSLVVENEKKGLELDYILQLRIFR